MRSLSYLALCAFLLSNCPTFSLAQTLPVFRVKPRALTQTDAVALGRALYAIEGDVRTTETEDKRLIIEPLKRPTSSSGTVRIEIDTINGGLYTADEALHRNTSDALAGQKLPDEEGALTLASGLVKKLSLLPELKGPFKLAGRPKVGGTFLASESEGRPRTERQLDVSVNYDIAVNLGQNEGDIPLLGGGGKFKFTFGDSGKVIGYQGVWRDVVGNETYRVVPKDKADDDFLTKTKDALGDKLLSFNSTLAYYSAPFGDSQEFLYPVYAYEGTAKIGNDIISLRTSFVPATEFGPKDDTLREQLPPRKPEDPARLKHRAVRPQHRPALTPRTLDDGIREAATEWLGIPYGLKKTEQNARGFREQLVVGSTPWTIKFNFGDSLVWETDFNAHDDIWVDAVDFMFYTGHAGKNGWMVNLPGAGTTLSYSVVGAQPQTPGDLWGQQDLEWLVIAACGPHQDAAFISGGGNVFDRWRGVFDGLHIMFAYGTVSADVSEEGRRLVKYAQAGQPLIDAWFRAASELQGSSVVVTAMWASGPAGDARYDHLPGYGYVSGDNLAPSQTRWFLWSTC